MSKLLEVYTHVCEAIGLEVDKDGLISRRAVEDTPSRPVTIEGKRLTLPNDYYLTAENVDGLIPFHPLSENIARGQSPVLKFLVKQCRANLTYKIVTLATQLVTIATHKEYQNRMPSVWDDFFRKVPQTDDKTEANFTKMMNEVLNLSSGVLSLFLKNGGKIDDIEYLRMCIVNFKLIPEIESRTPYGVTIRKKDADVFLEIFRYVLQDIEVENAYTVGVNTDTAPYFTALMKAYGNIATALNEKIVMLAHLDDTANEKIPTNYLKEMDALSGLRKAIPPLPGNEGANVKGEAKEEEKEEETKPDSKAKVKVSSAAKVDPPWEEEPKKVGGVKVSQQRDVEPRRDTRRTSESTQSFRKRRDEIEERGTQSFRRSRSRYDDYDDDRRDNRRDSATQSFRDRYGRGGRREAPVQEGRFRRAAAPEPRGRGRFRR